MVLFEGAPHHKQLKLILRLMVGLHRLGQYLLQKS
jgi:hypothetical protein